jgi:hypothetical protein
MMCLRCRKASTSKRPASADSHPGRRWPTLHSTQGVPYASVALIIPTDRLDRDIYLVLEDFRNGAAWRETDETSTDFLTLISDLLTGQYDQPLRVVAFNPLEGWSRDASEEVAGELARRLAEGCREISEVLREFIENHTGLAIGVQLALPFRGL